MSFKSEIEFSLLAGQTRFFPEHVVRLKNQDGSGILKMAVVYGANASGKSNLIKAIDFAKNVLTDGIKRTSTSQKWFRLTKDNDSKPSRFEFEFKVKGHTYAYGFEILLRDKVFVSEWFSEIVNSQEDLPIFERTVLPNGDSDFSGQFSPRGEAGKRYKLYQKDVTNNQLFLQEVSSRKTSDLPSLASFRNAYKWFNESLLVIYPESSFGGLDLIAQNASTKEAFQYFLRYFKTGIDDIDSIALDFDDALSQLPDEIKEKIETDLSNELMGDAKGAIVGVNGKRFTFLRSDDGMLKVYRLMAKHKSSGDSDSVLFEINEESDGTQRIFDFIPAMVRLSKENITLFIDEIDRSLHPELTRKLIEVFLKNSNNSESQLIVTTHESSLLDLDLLRRDEVWFVEKNNEGESKVYSLEEYSPQYDDVVRKAYLLGRYGAIPFISNVQELGWLNS